MGNEKILKLSMVLVAKGVIHVVRTIDVNEKRDRERNNTPPPNYLGTRKMLVGVLKKNETFENFWKRYISRLEVENPETVYILK